MRAASHLHAFGVFLLGNAVEDVYFAWCYIRRACAKNIEVKGKREKGYPTRATLDARSVVVTFDRFTRAVF